MAENVSRSQTAELREGMSDGKYKKLVQDRGGSVEPLHSEQLRDLAPQVYVVGEESYKTFPDGTRGSTPNYGS